MISAFVALVVTLLVLMPLVPLLRRLQVVDVPNERSSHSLVTPRGGGLAVMIGVLAGGLAGSAGADRVAQVQVASAIALAGGLAVVGLVDDLRGLGAWIRLIAQATAGLIGGIGVMLSSDPSPIVLVSLPVAALWVVAFVNAFNFMDGINGISGITGAVAGGWYGWLGVQLDDAAVAALGMTLVGACLAFLPWNLIDARVFLGDVGSYGLGCLIAVLALWVAIDHSRPIAAVAPLILYLVDTASTIVRRYRAGETLTMAHREHAYQRVTARGFAHAPTAIGVGVLTAVCCLMTAVLHPLPAVVGLVLVALIYQSAPSWLPAVRTGAA